MWENGGDREIRMKGCSNLGIEKMRLTSDSKLRVRSRDRTGFDLMSLTIVFGYLVCGLPASR